MDFYKLLGVARTASKEEIKRAFRKQALKFHPDRHAGSADKAEAAKHFKNVTEAYKILADDAARSNYNSFARHGGRGTSAGGATSTYGRAQSARGSSTSYDWQYDQARAWRQAAEDAARRNRRTSSAGRGSQGFSFRPGVWVDTGFHALLAAVVLGGAWIASSLGDTL